MILDDPALATAQVCVDAILRGALQLAQPKQGHGYRFNLDPILLSHFAMSCAGHAPQRVVDLGAGCGVVGLLLAHHWPMARVLLVELQPVLAALARLNVGRNQFDARAAVVSGDLRCVERWRAASAEPSLIVTNPPYYRLGSGPTSPDPMIAQAKHELCCSLVELAQALAAGMYPGDHLALIYPAQRRVELERALCAAGIQPLRWRPILPLPERPARRILVWARRCDHPLDTMPSSRRGELVRDTAAQDDVPLVVHFRPGVYSPEVQRLLEDGTAQ